MPGYTLDDGRTLKNKLGAATETDLARLETDALRHRLIEIELRSGPAGAFDAGRLKAIHRRLFQDVYEWAGRTRDERVTLSDGATATEPVMSKAGGKPFLSGAAISAALKAIGDRLRAEDCLRGLTREEFALRAADVIVDLNSIHPFREGNGRTQRVFMEQLAKQAGHDLDFTVVSRERMVQASIASHEHDDPSMMRRLFDEISDPARSALLREGLAALDRLGFDWNDRYVTTPTPGHSVDLVLAGVAGAQFMARTKSAIFFGRTADLPEPAPGRGEMFTLAAPPRV